MIGPGKFRIGVDLEKADFMGLSRILRTRRNSEKDLTPF